MNKLAIILLIVVIGWLNTEARIKKIRPKKGTLTIQHSGSKALLSKEREGTRTRGKQNKGSITAINNGSPTAINWYTLDEAKKVQKDKNLPLMIDFYASWCIWCKMFDEITFKDKEVIEESLNFIPARVDCTNDRTIANEYKILGLPTIVFEGTEGTRYDVIGFRWPKDFIKEMKKGGGY